jgi:hypothetical protein
VLGLVRTECGQSLPVRSVSLAVGAKAVPIRVQRSQASYANAKDVPHDGQLNKIVLENFLE